MNNKKCPVSRVHFRPIKQIERLLGGSERLPNKVNDCLELNDYLGKRGLERAQKTKNAATEESSVAAFGVYCGRKMFRTSENKQILGVLGQKILHANSIKISVQLWRRVQDSTSAAAEAGSRL